MEKSHKIIFIVLSLAVILWPALSAIGILSNLTSINENRRLAAFPGFPASVSELKRWPGKFNQYLDDNLGNRGSLIALDSWIKLNIFDTSPSNNVLLGESGWLFHNLKNDVSEFRCVLVRKKYQMRRLRVLLDERRDWLSEQGIDFYFVIAPTKQTIYPEYMPGYLPKNCIGQSRREMLSAEIRKSNSDSYLIDLTETLKNNKKVFGDTLYYKTDTHWTFPSAYLSSKLIIDVIKSGNKYSNIAMSDSIGTISDIRQTNLMSMIGLSHTETVERTVIRRPKIISKNFGSELLGKMAKRGTVKLYLTNKDAPDMYMMGDSFSSWNIGYLASAFHKTLLTNTWGNQWKRSEQFSKELINEYKPDIVIMQLLENRIDIGHARALLGDPDGKSNTPSIRQARLKRLFNLDKKIYKVNTSILGNTIIVDVPEDISSAKGTILRLKLNSTDKGMVSAISAHKKAWDDSCIRGGEFSSPEYTDGINTLYLCATHNPSVRKIELSLTNNSNVSVIDASLVEHSDI